MRQKGEEERERAHRDLSLVGRRRAGSWGSTGTRHTNEHRSSRQPQSNTPAANESRQLLRSLERFRRRPLEPASCRPPTRWTPRKLRTVAHRPDSCLSSTFRAAPPTCRRRRAPPPSHRRPSPAHCERRRRSSSTMMTTASDPAALRPVPCARRSSSTASCPRSAARARGRQGRRRRGDARRSVRRGGRCRKVRRNGGGRRKGWRGRGRGRRAARGRCLVGTRGGRRHHCPVRRTREVNDEKVQQEKGTTRRWATELVDEGEGGELGRLGNDLHLDALAPVLCEGCTVSSSRTGVGMTGERRAHLRRM